MLENRNKTSHIYNKEIAEGIFGRIQDKYLEALENILQKIILKYEDN